MGNIQQSIFFDLNQIIKVNLLKIISKLKLGIAFYPLIITLIFLLACNHNVENNIPTYIDKTNNNDSLNSYILQDGDIVLRKGNSIESETVSLVDGNGKYSHIGIIAFQDSIPYVIHIVPDSINSTIDYCLFQELTTFFAPENARFGCVLRINKNNKHYASIASKNAMTFYKNRIIFDKKYNMKSDSEMYCTELVWKAYHIDSLDIIEGNYSTSPIPFLTKKLILPSAFINSPHLEIIYYF